MKAEFDLLSATRVVVLKLVNELSLAQLNTVPNGYSNSIVWNVAHILVTQQILHYKFSFNDLLVPDDLLEKYKKGTTFEEAISASEWSIILDLFNSLPEKLQLDYSKGKFSSYETYLTSYGYEIHSIEEAIAFNNVHEALHLGYIMAMKKLI
jgi:hypothetical protein